MGGNPPQTQKPHSQEAWALNFREVYGVKSNSKALMGPSRLFHLVLVLLGLGFRRGAARSLGPYWFRHCNCWRFSYHVHAAKSPCCCCCSHCCFYSRSCSYSCSWRHSLACVVVVSAMERRGDEILVSEVYLSSEEVSRMAMSKVKEEHEFYIVYSRIAVLLRALW